MIESYHVKLELLYLYIIIYNICDGNATTGEVKIRGKIPRDKQGCKLDQTSLKWLQNKEEIAQKPAPVPTAAHTKQRIINGSILK